MKKIVLLAHLILITNILSAQSYNLGFEDWDSSITTNSANNFPNECYLPIDANIAIMPYALTSWTNIPFGLMQTSDAHSDSYAAVVSIWYNGAMGRLILGQGCENEDIPGYEICKNHFTSKIYGISGYYKYVVDSFIPNDTYNKRVTAHIKTYKIDTATSSLELMSHDSLIYEQSNTYQPFNLAINYPDPSSVPDSVSIWFESQGYGSGVTYCGYSHFLFLDDLEFHFSPMSSSINNPSLKKKLKIYPNPAKGKINIECDNEVHIQTLSLADINGKVVRKYKHNCKVLDITNIPSGIYFLKIETEQGALTEKIIIQ